MGYNEQILFCTSLKFLAIATAIPKNFASFKTEFATFRSIRQRVTSLLYFEGKKSDFDRRGFKNARLSFLRSPSSKTYNIAYQQNHFPTYVQYKSVTESRRQPETHNTQLVTRNS